MLLLLEVLLSAGVVSCMKPVSETASEGSGMVALEVRLAEDPGMTKASTPAGDAAVVGFTACAYGSDGVLTSSARVSGSSGSGTLSVRREETYTVGVIVNNPSTEEAPATLTAFKAYSSRYEDNVPGSFRMWGVKEGVVISGASQNVSVNAGRRLARVKVGAIVNGLSETGFAGKTLTVTDIYLSNVPAGTCIHSSGAYTGAMTWLNLYGQQTGVTAGNSLLHESISAGVLAHGESLSGWRYLYAAENPTSGDTHLKNGAARHTRLVIKASIDAKEYYYPVTLPVIEGNHEYTISSLTIRRRGVDDPEKEIPDGWGAFTLSVSDWKESARGEKTF